MNPGISAIECSIRVRIPGVRYYDKSKIEEEIEELRSSGGREFWRETKRSIKVRRLRRARALCAV